MDKISLTKWLQIFSYSYKTRPYTKAYNVSTYVEFFRFLKLRYPLIFSVRRVFRYIGRDVKLIVYYRNASVNNVFVDCLLSFLLLDKEDASVFIERNHIPFTSKNNTANGTMDGGYDIHVHLEQAEIVSISFALSHA